MRTVNVFSHSTDVPPLEDMTDYVEKAKTLKSHLERNRSKPITTHLCTHPSKPTTNEASANGRHERLNTKVSTSFGGFQKGFLSSSSVDKEPLIPPNAKRTEVKKATVDNSKTSPSKPVSEKEIPFIRGQKGNKGEGIGMVFPEVQEAMKASFPILQSQG